LVSGLLGIGSGALKVPAMDLAMRLPLKVSTATSNFMIGVTAAASAGVYFARGDINPFIAAPVAAGVLIGATGGSRLLGRVKNNVVRITFVIVLCWISLEMLWKGFHPGEIAR
ncbi:MAG: sulfite exporter TauE/SafE family protein, partial [Phycisphaerae bacterium]|nr:sulfite exporter TauE/SafE family protein [Phycisphaerae bacterium]